MNWNWLFPYRTHLLAEVEYLKSKLAQSEYDVRKLQDALIQAAKPKIVFKSAPDGKLTRIPPPKGWDAFRAATRNKPEEEAKGETHGTQSD